VTRHGRGDKRSPWYPEQAVSIQDALWAYTMGAATATGEQDSKGSLAPGKVADMVVLSADIFSSVKALEQARVACSIVAGAIAAGGL
jgi:predicted amidohydrolase YtcJ